MNSSSVILEQVLTDPNYQISSSMIVEFWQQFSSAYTSTTLSPALNGLYHILYPIFTQLTTLSSGKLFFIPNIGPSIIISKDNNRYTYQLSIASLNSFINPEYDFIQDVETRAIQVMLEYSKVYQYLGHMYLILLIE